MRKYNTPELEFSHLSKEDVLSGSDVFIDGSILFSDDTDVK